MAVRAYIMSPLFVREPLFCGYAGLSFHPETPLPKQSETGGHHLGIETGTGFFFDQFQGFVQRILLAVCSMGGQILQGIGDGQDLASRRMFSPLIPWGNPVPS